MLLNECYHISVISKDTDGNTNSNFTQESSAPVWTGPKPPEDVDSPSLNDRINVVAWIFYSIMSSPWSNHFLFTESIFPIFNYTLFFLTINLQPITWTSECCKYFYFP